MKLLFLNDWNTFGGLERASVCRSRERHSKGVNGILEFPYIETLMVYLIASVFSHT